MTSLLTFIYGQLLFTLLFYFHQCDSVSYKELYFDQQVDHFHFFSQSPQTDTFKQRYLVQDDWWLEGRGPIFFYAGNEGDIVGFWNNTGFVFEIAPTFKALVIFAEHRYYGKSLPFGKMSFEHPYVDLLTTEQALADYAVLISELKQQLNATSCPVIAFGGSYGGMLSAYMRFRYPNIIAGSIAASAPILGVTNLTPRHWFFQDVTNDFDGTAKGCKAAVVQAFSTVQQLFNAGSAGLQNVSLAFNTCSILQASDYRHLVGWARNAFTVLAMMDYPYPTDFLAPLPGFPVLEACKRLLAANQSVGALAAVTDMVYGKKCHEIWKEYIECADPTGCGLGTDSLAWDYQVCTEFIMPDGSNNVTDMFPGLSFTLAERDEYCVRRWQVKPRNNWAQISFWGNDLSAASNVVFSNGLLDPWARGGIMKNISNSVIAVIIEGGAHHLDLRSSNAADPQSVIRAREIEVDYIHKWIQEAQQKHL